LLIVEQILENEKTFVIAQQRVRIPWKDCIFFAKVFSTFSIGLEKLIFVLQLTRFVKFGKQYFSQRLY
jgi:hypothetical protein